jgi:hypothetical protein
MPREIDPEMLAIRERARVAVRKWLRARTTSGEREARREALDKLACVRPSKTLTVDGVRCKAVTSRSEIVIIYREGKP